MSEWQALDHIRCMQAFMSRLAYVAHGGKAVGSFDEGGDLSAMAFVQRVLDRECVW